MIDKTTKLNLIKLKVKAKSLAEEARIIRNEVRKYGRSSDSDNEKGVLTFHRTWDVRNEARATQLAIAFLKGKDYKKIEPKCNDTAKLGKHIEPRVREMVKKYSSYTYRKNYNYPVEIQLWLDVYGN